MDHYVDEPRRGDDRYMLVQISHNKELYAANYEEQDLFYSSWSNPDRHTMIRWIPPTMRHESQYRLATFRNFTEMYAWMKTREEQFTGAAATSQFHVTLERPVGSFLSRWRILDASRSLSGPEFYTHIGNQSAPPEIDEILIETDRRILRTVPHDRKPMPTSELNNAQRMAANYDFDIKDFVPYGHVPEGSSYVMRVHVPGTSPRYLAAILTGPKGQVVRYMLAASPVAALKFSTRGEVLDAYFSTNAPIASGDSSYSGLHAFLRLHNISVEIYSPLTGRTEAPAKTMNYQQVVAFDMALKTEQACLSLMAQHRAILRSTTLAGRRLVGVDIDKTANSLQAILHVPNIEQPEYETYMVQFRPPMQKLEYTWGRGNILLNYSREYLAEHRKCREFKHVCREALMTLIESQSVRNYVLSTLCPDTNIRICALRPTAPRIIAAGLWTRLTHSGYDSIRNIAATVQTVKADRKPLPSRQIIRNLI